MRTYLQMMDNMESSPEASKRRPGRRDRRDVYLVKQDGDQQEKMMVVIENMPGLVEKVKLAIIFLHLITFRQYEDR